MFENVHGLSARTELNFCQGPGDVAVLAFLPVTQVASWPGELSTLVSRREKKQGARALTLLCRLGGSRGVTAADVPLCGLVF